MPKPIESSWLRDESKWLRKYRTLALAEIASGAKKKVVKVLGEKISDEQKEKAA
jgi:hypothetical protein